MEVQVGLITRWDNNPAEDFAHEFGEWADGDPATDVKNDTGLSRDVFTGVNQVRTVATHGLQPPVHGKLTVTPPKYPPVRMATYVCDSSLLGTIIANSAYMVLSVDDIGNGVPAAAENRGLNDPLPDDDFDSMATKIVSLTRSVIGEEQADSVAAALLNWRENNPTGTPNDFYLAVRRFSS